ncbi:hypothetical protein DFH06DRAFT_992842 [Mycena polygramma]|nr:hypothetical protein DFH06DRAFT_992842 [Mycena polygramma]
MPPKRKSDVSTSDLEASSKENEVTPVATKKARVAAASSSSKPKEAVRWQDVELETDPDGEIPVYDTPGDVRRKIRALLSTPGFKVTHWLQEIGGINSNSYGRFMKEKNKHDGAANGTYYAAYCYFEKVRIAENKPKSAGRKKAERESSGGHVLEDRRKGWVFAPA